MRKGERKGMRMYRPKKMSVEILTKWQSHQSDKVLVNYQTTSIFFTNNGFGVILFKNAKIK